MYQLLVLDIDDTLTLSPYDVPAENLAAIRRAQAAGIYVTIATGRGYLGSAAIRKAIGMQGPVINYGGAVIHDTRTDAPIFQTTLPPALVRELLLLGRELACTHTFIRGTGSFMRKKTRPQMHTTGF